MANDVTNENVVPQEIEWGESAAEKRTIADYEREQKQLAALNEAAPTEAENQDANDAPAAENKDAGNPTEQANEEKQKDTKPAPKTTNDILKELLTEPPKKPEIKEPETEEDITKVQMLEKEKAELERKVQVSEEVTLIRDLLSQINDAERDIIGPELVEIIKSGERKRFADLPVKERVAKMIKIAQANKLDDLIKIRSLAPREKGEEITEITSIQTGKPAKESKTSRIEALKQAALDGDTAAQEALWSLDPEEW